MSSVTAALDAVRQPEYVGENRCVPCTIVNAVIALVLAATAWLLLDPIAALGVLVVAAAAIGLRGYLVPGTPTLTKRYLPDRVLAMFDKAPETTGAVTTEDGAPAEVDVEQVLLSTGILAPCADVDDLCLAEPFRAAWRDEMTAVRDEDATPTAVADLLDVDADGLEIRERGPDAFVATYDGVRVGQWESHAALIADAAAADLVAARDDEWQRRPIAARGELLGGLRLFLEACPDCGGDVSLGRETVESCCRSRDVVAVSCADCGARLFEADFEN